MIQIALLRAINVGGRAPVPMAELREMLGDLGLGNPRTLLHSGNAVFDGGSSRGAALEAVLEAETERRFGHRPKYFVRTDKEWDAIIAANPFPAAAKSDPARFMAIVLDRAPAPGDVAALQAAIAGPERAAVAGRVAYVIYPDGMGKSRFTTAVIERALHTQCTARNWNTVLKIAALARERG